MNASSTQGNESRPREVDARGNCSKCGGTHYGTGWYCPMPAEPGDEALAKPVTAGLGAASAPENGRAVTSPPDLSCNCGTVSDDYSDHRLQCPFYLSGVAARKANASAASNERLIDHMDAVVDALRLRPVSVTAYQMRQAADEIQRLWKEHDDDVGRMERAVIVIGRLTALTAWVACADRLPPLNQEVLLLNANRRRSNEHHGYCKDVGYRSDVGTYDGNSYWSTQGEMRAMTLDAFTHWLPLPEFSFETGAKGA